jgi:sensor c-di-GMP phosphodiesterase-like protein
MLIWIKARIRILSLTILGLIVGALGGLWLGRAMLLRTAKADLSAYADELRRNADGLSDEINSILLEMNAPAVPACSNPDLTALRAQTFRYVHVKDVGRTHDGKLYCSAFLGRLARPHIEGAPSLVLANGANVYTHAAVLMDSKGAAQGTIVEAGDVNVVLNSNAFGNWDRPHIGYMVAAINREIGQVTEIAGSKLEIGPAWVLSQKSQIVQGTIYRAVCSSSHPVCVVTAERVTDVWNSARSTQLAYAAMGGFAGFFFGLAIALLDRRASSLANQLLRAVRKNSSSLHLVYQPIVDVGTGRCMGAEALLRWTDQNGVSIPPDSFIPLAEEKGFINELTAFVVRRATRELAELLHDCEEFTLSVNVAASDMGGEQLFELLKEHVLLAGILPRHVALELTERSTADLVLVRAAIQRLTAEGYKVHIDDFGTGFSSLSYIDQLRVNAIKIDRAFTRTIGTDAVIAPILSQMLEMASSLGVEVVVEGVETEAQRDYLAASGKTLRAQGWYFSRPLSAEALYSFHAKNKAVPESVVNRQERKLLSLDASARIDPTSTLRASGLSDEMSQASLAADARVLVPSV